jgi:hypothetical protein
LKKPLADIIKFIKRLIGILAPIFLWQKIAPFLPPKIALTIIIVSIISCYFTYQTSNYILPRKGLKHADLKRIYFTKKWFNVRQQGMWRFLIIDGAIILGALFSLCICLLVFSYSGNGNITTQLSSPGDIFSLIGYSYLAGAVIAIAFNLTIWFFNERKFNRLTNPI